MFSQFIHSDTLEHTQPRVSGPTARTLLIGLGLGSLLAYLWPTPSGLAAIALVLSGIAAGFFGAGFAHHRRQGSVSWGLLIGGQLTSILAIGLLFIVSIAG